MTTDSLRKKFLDFFTSKDHKVYPSDSLAPGDDATLLFTSAGMNQFKQEFLGKPTDIRRRVTSQKCLRTGDLDKVGKTNYHHTFFEMLGNFSFGDYFKDEAIAWAWEFITKELGLPEGKLWVSVYKDDSQAYKIWKEKIKVKPSRIVKLGAKSNFWPSNAPEDGPNGPCGPCSEIFYDQGKSVGCRKPNCNPECECGRFVEVWNLVFTQFERKGKNKLEPLPSKNIDTGMGLERIAAVLQGKTNNFEIDIFEKIIEQIVSLVGRSPNLSSPPLRAIADHIRAVTFAISDGVLPSNDERGYVIRKLIRRAVWHGRTLAIRKPYLYRLIPMVCKVMRGAYPELQTKREEIAQVVLAEEKRFRQTLERAMHFAEDIIIKLKKEGKKELPGRQMFKLYDTYGLPEEMLKNIVRSHNFRLDKKGFAQELEFQRKTSREGSAISKNVFEANLVSKFKLKPTKFVGEKDYSAVTKIVSLFKNDKPVDQVIKGDEAKIILEATPFYGESGGQIGDTGVIKTKDGQIEVVDTHKVDQVHIHLGKVTSGEVKIDDQVEAEINNQRRKNIIRNHSATHLLQAVLRKILGEHVRQSGSWVGPDKLRFDFTHFQALNKRQLARIEQLVNGQIKQNRKSRISIMSFEQAQKAGALAFFGEKYQEKVRVVEVSDISSELCGGTHVSSTGEIGTFKIVGESSVASGIRRIEAVTAGVAEDMVKEHKSQLQEFAKDFNALEDDLPDKVDEYLRKIKEFNRRLDKTRIDTFKSRADEIIESAEEISGIKIITQEVKGAQIEMLRLMSDILRQKAKKAVVVLASASMDKVLMICALTDNVCSKNLDAGKIICILAKEISGSGGGKASFAQAGGTNPDGINKAFKMVKEIINQGV